VEPILGKAIPIPSELASCMEGEREVTAMPPKTEELERFLLEY
jgi:hypothetical protein